MCSYTHVLDVADDVDDHNHGSDIADKAPSTRFGKANFIVFLKKIDKELQKVWNYKLFIAHDKTIKTIIFNGIIAVIIMTEQTTHFDSLPMT